MTRRYVPVTERSMRLAEGVMRRAALMNLPIGTPQYHEAERSWEEWKKRWPDLAQKAIETQDQLFDWCTAQ